MKPLKHIEQAKNLVDILTYELHNRKDQRNVKRDATRINTIIALVNAFEEMLNERYYTDVIETLLYSLIYEWLLQYNQKDSLKEYYQINKDGSETLVQNESYGKELKIPIHDLVWNIENDIRYGTELKKAEVISLLQHKELSCKLENDPYEVFDTPTDFKGMLDKLVNEFKVNIKWEKR